MLLGQLCPRLQRIVGHLWRLYHGYLLSEQGSTNLRARINPWINKWLIRNFASLIPKQGGSSIHWSCYGNKNIQNYKSIDCCDNICFWYRNMSNFHSSRCWFLATLHSGKIRFKLWLIRLNGPGPFHWPGLLLVRSYPVGRRMILSNEKCLFRF